MNDLKNVSFSEFIEGMAKKAGLPIDEKTEEYVTFVCQLKDRYQRVWVRPYGVDFKERRLIVVSSPAMVLVKGQELNQKVANDLLKDNCIVAHGGWGIEQTVDGDYLVALDTITAETLEPEELEASVSIVAMLADEMEQNLNKDTF